jgi:hypothetical protein
MICTDVGIASEVASALKWEPRFRQVYNMRLLPDDVVRI